MGTTLQCAPEEPGVPWWVVLTSYVSWTSTSGARKLISGKNHVKSSAQSELRISGNIRKGFRLDLGNAKHKRTERGIQSWRGSRPSAMLPLEHALVFPEEEGMMQQSSVSISLSFWEPRYQSSRRLCASPSYLHKTNKSSQPTQIGVVNPYSATYESEI